MASTQPGFDHVAYGIHTSEKNSDATGLKADATDPRGRRGGGHLATSLAKCREPTLAAGFRVGRERLRRAAETSIKAINKARVAAYRYHSTRVCKRSLRSQLRLASHVSTGNLSSTGSPASPVSSDRRARRFCYLRGGAILFSSAK